MRNLILLLLASAPGPCVGSELDVETHCLDCHRPTQQRGEVPLIEGQHREYLEHQLTRFRERHRDSFPMSALMDRMDDASLGVLASALEERAWRSVATPPAAEAARRGAEVARRRDCGVCHGRAYEGVGDIPRLAGQHPGYLARQIEGFGHGDRYHPPSGTGAPMHVIPAAEARDLAAFFNALDQVSVDAARE
jgi:cytochrome c553